jgi:hypothetical protein
VGQQASGPMAWGEVYGRGPKVSRCHWVARKRVALLFLALTLVSSDFGQGLAVYGKTMVHVCLHTQGQVTGQLAMEAIHGTELLVYGCMECEQRGSLEAGHGDELPGQLELFWRPGWHTSPREPLQALTSRASLVVAPFVLSSDRDY